MQTAEFLEKRERARGYSLKYKNANRDKISVMNKNYYEEQKVVLKTGPLKTSVYHQEKSKQYYIDNKEKIRKYNKEYRQTDKGKQIAATTRWRSRGVINDDFDGLYKRYRNTHQCETCDYVFDEVNKRCLDHDHETGLVRGIICNACNSGWVNVNPKLKVFL
tara:strand:- start:970 stop:1455 length:486 start_codon:yes stop_codon:yes gene_type:complete